MNFRSIFFRRAPLRATAVWAFFALEGFSIRPPQISFQDAHAAIENCAIDATAYGLRICSSKTDATGDAFEVNRKKSLKSRRSPRTSPVWTNPIPLRYSDNKCAPWAMWLPLRAVDFVTKTSRWKINIPVGISCAVKNVRKAKRHRNYHRAFVRARAPSKSTTWKRLTHSHP